jgi:hypothetical protein
MLTNGINALSCRAKSRHPVTAPLDNSGIESLALADFVRCVAASTPLRFAQNDNAVFPLQLFNRSSTQAYLVMLSEAKHL